ncbi:MAG: sigma-70 family RNA polymerase sigma factor [Planctomycetes bacterium]|nr:sigma-70 family RNA polymerase sigma factor [Planctomycetota bacterium]
MRSSSHHPDQLLTHAAFLRGLAADLARGDADDLQQATFAAALRRPPAHAGNERGWLATIAANLWRNELRGRSRRRRHEAQRPAGDAVPTPAEIAEREEVRRRVVAAVAALPETLRAVVVLRYYEGLESAAIGARLQLAPSTVRSRLQQAVGRLRAQLDEQHGGSRAAWVGPLLAWQHAAQTPLPVAGTRRLAWLATAAAATLLVALVALAWSTHEPRPAKADASVARSEPVLPAGDLVPAAERVDAPRDPAPPSPAATTADLLWQPPLGALRGLVVAAGDGAPVPAAQVVARRLQAPSSPYAPLRSTPAAERTTDTAVDGTFDLFDLPVGDYDLDVSTADGRHAWVRLPVGETPRDVRLTLTARACRGEVRVRVVDGSGRGLTAAVQVAVHSRRSGCFGWDRRPPLEGTAGDDGWFVLRDRAELDPIESGVAVARTEDGRVGIAKLWTAHGTTPTSTTVTVAAPGTIVGVLSGLPNYAGVGIVAHASQTLVFGPDCFAVRGEVAGDGSFRIEGLPPADYKLQVTGLARRADKEQYWNTTTTTVAAGTVTSSDPPVLACIAGARLHGIVCDTTGRPIAGASVTAVRPWFNKVSRYVLHHREREASRWFRTVAGTTAADGTYELALEPGEWHLIALAPGHAMDVHLGLTIGGGNRVDLTHTLPADGGIAVRSVTSVVLRHVDRPDEWHALGGGGVDELRGLRAGSWELGSVDGGTFTPTTRVEVAVGRITWVDLARGEARELRGVLLHRGEPLADHEVQIDSGRPTRTAADGSFVLPHVAVPGTEPRLVVRRHGIEVAATEQLEGVIELGGRRIEIETVGADGTPQPARIQIGSTFDGGGRRYDVEHNRGSTQLATGRLQLLLCDVDEFSAVVATFADGSRTHARIGDANHLRLAHRPAGSIAVRVLDVGGLPVAGQRVTALGWGHAGEAPSDANAFADGCADEDEVVVGTTDADGRAELRGVLPGPTLLRVWVAGSGGAEARQVAVTAGTTTPVEVVLGR